MAVDARIPNVIKRICKYCGSPMDVRMIPKFDAPCPPPEDSVIIFALNLPVAICPTCDSSADPSSRGIHEHMAG